MKPRVAITMFKLCPVCKKVASQGCNNYVDIDNMEKATKQAIIVMCDDNTCFDCINKKQLESFKKRG
jgi:Holliday junction resolvase RusA-like endonuclease